MFGILILASLTACGLREPGPTAQATPTPPIVQVTADQIAQAMADDRFFSDYGQTTLRVTGTVTAVIQQGNDVVVQLASSVPTKVLCDVGAQPANVQVSQQVTVQSSDPERATKAILLRNCRVL